ncbi:protein NATD1-like [Notolabrus celidotus]|uniref:protein NATD1-like n=1 Tax=Notolabrus celidotus TaxID=1203425 RepID=UPI0014902160|nr:protein NATD1-like [Notolabrus celidotus]
MTSKICSRLSPLAFKLKCCPSFSSVSSSHSVTVEHDRTNRRFTVSPGSSGTGTPEDQAILKYRYTGDREVDLMSTYVPEIFRGQGVAARLSQAALDFVVEENMKAHVSCWYIKKYIEENPEHLYKERIIS